MDPQHASYNYAPQSWGQILPKDKMNYDVVPATRAPTAWGGECMGFQYSDQSTNSRHSRTSNANNTPASTPPTDMGSYDEVSPIQNIGKFELFEDEYSRPYLSLSPDLQGIYSTNDHAHSSDPSGTSRATPTTLGWTPDTQLPKLYNLVLKKGEEYLELMPGYEVNEETPQRVYLDKDEDHQKGFYPCKFPGICVNKKEQRSFFTRPADLERHYRHVHNSIDKLFHCDYAKCSRAKEPFTRKDHYRDHLKDYHKEDIGAAKGEKAAKTAEQKREWQAAQQVWKKERVIWPNQWRCAKCLGRVYVELEGWNCIVCKQECEHDRQKSRKDKAALGIVDDAPAESFLDDGIKPDAIIAGAGPDYETTPPPLCSTCNGAACILNIHNNNWDACPNCQPPTQSLYNTADTYGYTVSYLQY